MSQIAEHIVIPLPEDIDLTLLTVTDVPPLTDAEFLASACRDNWEPFFYAEHETGGAKEAKNAAARLICDSCVIKPRCRAVTLASEEVDGFRAGLSEEERVAIVKARRKAARLAKVLPRL